MVFFKRQYLRPQYCDSEISVGSISGHAPLNVRRPRQRPTFLADGCRPHHMAAVPGCSTVCYSFTVDRKHYSRTQIQSLPCFVILGDATTAACGVVAKCRQTRARHLDTGDDRSLSLSLGSAQPNLTPPSQGWLVHGDMGTRRHPEDLIEYVRMHRACQGRMVLGLHCESKRKAPLYFEATGKQKAQAVATVENMAFVGLTDYWHESICLFHAMFGGRITKHEMDNVR